MRGHFFLKLILKKNIGVKLLWVVYYCVILKESRCEYANTFIPYIIIFPVSATSLASDIVFQFNPKIKNLMLAFLPQPFSDWKY